MYSTLVTSVIHGTANGTVLNFDDEQDGRSAWFTLCDWYESQGSTDNMVKRLTDDISTYKLTAGTHFGAEGYISRFQRNLYELKQLGQPLTKTMQKQFFKEYFGSFICYDCGNSN